MDDTVVEFSREAKLQEIAREIAMRRNVYKSYVRRGLMTQAKAEHQLAIMLAIAKDYGGHGGEQD
jgi:hypothetical protein